mgnify:CR=1 FL=1
MSRTNRKAVTKWDTGYKDGQSGFLTNGSPTGYKDMTRCQDNRKLVNVRRRAWDKKVINENI